MFTTLLAFALTQPPQPLQLSWTVGDVATYAARQKTTVDEILPNEITKKLQSGGNIVTMALTYTWTVAEISPAGVATLHKRVTSLKSETKRTIPGKDGQPTTETDILDSSLAADREKMPFLNKVAVIAKVDRKGAVIEASSDFGQAAVDRFKTELPFRMTLPAQAPSMGQSFTREYAITLDPKYGGTGEQYPVVQTATYKGTNGSFSVFGIASRLKSEPKTAMELRPLIPLLWEGDVFFDSAKGKYHACQLTATRELKDHEGEGTKFAYRSEYTEALQAK
jgi:hypothetical protein